MSILRFLNTLNQKGLAKAAYAHFQVGSKCSMCRAVEVCGETEERAKLIAACEWLKGVSPDLIETVERNVKRVIVLGLDDNAVLPLEHTIILSPKWLSSFEAEAVGRFLVRSGRYVHDCEVNGTFRVWRIPIENVASVLSGEA